MDNKEFIISFCVPTYKQPQKIDKFLRNIQKQITPEVEIVIRDDSPDSETEEVVKKYADKFSSQIMYFKMEKSAVGGYDKALLFLTEAAKGKYVWWFGDDLLDEGAVDKVLNLVKKNPEISFIWMNGCNINNRNDIGLTIWKEDCLFDNPNEILKEDIGLLGFPTATILKREKAVLGIEGAKKFIGTTLTGFYLVLHNLSSSGKFYFIQKPYILSDPKPVGEARWYDSFQVHGINYFLIAQEFKDKFDKRILRKALAKKFSLAWRAVVVERAKGFTTGFASRTPKIKQMFKCYWNYPEFYIALPLFLMPRFALKYLYKLWKRKVF